MAGPPRRVTLVTPCLRGLGARACVTLGLPPGMRRDGSAVWVLRSAGGRGPRWLPARMVRSGPFREEGVSG